MLESLKKVKVDLTNLSNEEENPYDLLKNLQKSDFMLGIEKNDFKDKAAVELQKSEVKEFLNDYVTIAKVNNSFSNYFKSNKNIIVKVQRKLKDLVLKIHGTKETFLKEVKIMMSLRDHPNVVNIMGFFLGKIDGKIRYCLLMDYLPNSLENFLQSKPNFSKKMKIIYEISRAMVHIHSKDIIYLDLKMDNVMLNESNIVRIVDFDSSLHLKDLVEKEKYQLVGTSYYASPEIYKGQKYSFSADVYSFGILVLEIIQNGKLDIDQQLVKNISFNSSSPLYSESNINDENREIFELIQECCANQDDKRPTFVEILETVERIYFDTLSFDDLTKVIYEKTVEKSNLQREKIEIQKELYK